MRRLFAVLFLTACLAVPAMAPHALLPHAWASDADTALGRTLVSDIFADLKAGRTDEVAARLDPAFQSVHQDGARLRKAQADLLRLLHVGEYVLSDFTTTRSKDTLVVSYTVSVAETIDAARLSTTKAWRLSVFTLRDGRWLWTAHANLRPLSR